MSSYEDPNYAYILSRNIDLFQNSIGHKIAKLTCHFSSSFDADDLKARNILLFHDSGTLLMTLENGLKLDFGSNCEICCLMISALTPQKQDFFDSHYKTEIASNHPEYSTPRIAALVGQTIKKINLYKEEFRDIRTKAFPWETGVEFVLENGISFFIAYGYQDETDRLCLVFPDEVHLNISDWWSIFETIE